MPRKPDERIDKAKELFLKGTKLVEIASQLGLPEGTVRRWKSTHNWDNERSDKKANVRNKKEDKKEVDKRAVAEEVEQVIDNPDLTDKQRLFCLYYIKSFNATKAYQKAYKVTYDVANAEGYKLLVNPCIREEILRLKQERLQREFLSESDIFQKYMDIAFADITDYVNFGKRQYTDPDTGEAEWYSFVELEPSREVDGTLISEVSKGKSGIKIKLNDRMKALQWLTEHMELATEEQRARIEQMKVQTKRLSGTESKEELEKLDKVLADIKGVI